MLSASQDWGEEFVSSLSLRREILELDCVKELVEVPQPTAIDSDSLGCGLGIRIFDKQPS